MSDRDLEPVWKKVLDELYPSRPDKATIRRQRQVIRDEQDAVLVQCAIHRAWWSSTAVVGPADVISAMEGNRVGELLMTHRFVDACPGAAERMLLRAARDGVVTRVVMGWAACELDIAASGVAALLRPAIGYRGTDPVLTS